LVGWDLTPPNPLGEPATEFSGAGSLGPNARELLAGAEDHELAHLDVVVAELSAEFVECRLDGWRFRDRVAAAFRGHRGQV
jgi:hypothetical protein